MYAPFRSSYCAPSTLSSARSRPLIVTRNGSLRFSGSAQGVLRADQIGANGVAIAKDVMDLSARLFTLIPNAGRVIGEHPLRAAQVGDAHSREQHSVQLLGREGDRHADDATEDAVLAQDVPEGLALTKQPHISPSEWDMVLADLDRPAGRPDLDRAQLGAIGAQVRRKEVEDIVLARVHTGLKGGPRHWRDGGDGRAERFETTLVSQRSEVGELSLLEHLFRQLVVHSVKAQDHDPLHPAAPQRSPAKEQTRQQPHRPGEHRDESRQDRGEDGEK